VPRMAPRSYRKYRTHVPQQPGPFAGAQERGLRVFVHPTARTNARFWRTHLWDEAVAFSPPFAALECLCVGAAAFITGSDDA
jgi:hypothetical protein